MAALTIPSLVAKNQEKEMVVRLKKTYNVLNEAYSLASMQYGDPSLWGWTADVSAQGANNAMDAVAPFLNIIRRCNQEKGCFKTDYMYKGLSGGNWYIWDGPTVHNPSKAILADGSSFLIFSKSRNCEASYGEGRLNEICGGVVIDVNGLKGPNVMGKDMHNFHATRKGIIPFGVEGDVYRPLKNWCKGADGSGCTAWALIKENMEYPPYGTGWE